jgi:ABC-type spermidine/putrescine transport system permease subunit II
MSDLPVKTQSFEDRFMDKLREAMGAMMTEDELRKLIERGVEKFLFEPRRVTDTRGYSCTVEKPPLLQELLEKHLHDRMSAAWRQSSVNCGSRPSGPAAAWLDARSITRSRCVWSGTRVWKAWARRAVAARSRAIDWATPWLRPGEGRRPEASAGLSLPRSVRSVLDIAGLWIGRALLAGGLFLLIFPLLMVVVNSVNNVPQATTAVWRGFTLRWYEAIFTQGSRYFDAAIISAQLAGAAILVAIAIALPAAFVLARRPSKGVLALNAFYMLPLALPGIALAIGMLKLLQIFVMVPPFLGLLLIHVVLIVPFTLAMLRATVLQLDVRLEEAASSLGANRVKTFLLIILPGLGPGLVAAGIIGFLISFGEVTVTAFLATARMQTLPVRIYGDVQFDVEPTVNAVSALLILGTIMMLLIVNRFMRLDRVWHR